MTTTEPANRTIPGHEDLPEVTESNEVAGILTSDQYFKRVQHANTRPAFWKFSDVMGVLERLGEDPLVEAERRFCTTINDDCGDLTGATPFCFIGWQLIHPGEHVPPHRHNSFAIYHILQGNGYTVVEGEKYVWERGDTLACPAWAQHEHVAEGEEPTLMYVVQDMPMLAASRTLMWEEPIGPENNRHMVLGTAPSWSATRTDLPS
ncbi:MAG: cupin domain-containing protein [bacterium]|nr:cupin domain-containing protein [bacterium]MYH72503.1 cupin domain-containing protein [Acidimicrobiia bacterium]